MVLIVFTMLIIGDFLANPPRASQPDSGPPEYRSHERDQEIVVWLDDRYCDSNKYYEKSAVLFCSWSHSGQSQQTRSDCSDTTRDGRGEKKTSLAMTDRLLVWFTLASVDSYIGHKPLGWNKYQRLLQSHILHCTEAHCEPIVRKSCSEWAAQITRVVPTSL